VTVALATADDDAVVELVSERRAMREELRAVREGEAGVVQLGRRAGTVAAEGVGLDSVRDASTLGPGQHVATGALAGRWRLG
jgi:hypothetical protein